MVPGFNPKEWDRDKILDWVIGDEPLTDQQLEFLIYFGQLKNRVQELEAELKEANDSITWWKNRWNAYERDNRMQCSRLNGIDNVISHWLKPLRHDATFRSNPIYVLEMMELQNIARGNRDAEILKAFNNNNQA